MTSTTTARPDVSWRTVYQLALLARSLDSDELEQQATPAPDVERAIRTLFPALTRPQADWLWDRARIDAAALDQLRTADLHLWPLCDMDQPRRGTWQFDEFERELEQSVRAYVIEAHSVSGVAR